MEPVFNFGAGTGLAVLSLSSRRLAMSDGHLGELTLAGSDVSVPSRVS